MASGIVCEIFRCLEQVNDPLIRRIEREEKIPWPGQDETIWPKADLSGELNTGEKFIIEIDDHDDPARSVVKYWPLLEAIELGRFDFPPIRFIEVSSPDETYGYGYHLLARFIGKQFERLYPTVFRFAYLALADREAEDLAVAILKLLRGEGS